MPARSRVAAVFSMPGFIAIVSASRARQCVSGLDPVHHQRQRAGAVRAESMKHRGAARWRLEVVAGAAGRVVALDAATERRQQRLEGLAAARARRRGRYARPVRSGFQTRGAFGAGLVRTVSARTGLSGSGVPSSSRGPLGVSGQHTYCSVWECVLVSASCSAPLACGLGSQPIPMGSARRLVVLGAFPHPVLPYVQGSAKALQSAGCARPVSRSGSDPPLRGDLSDGRRVVLGVIA